jgi:hypothetical protein
MVELEALCRMRRHQRYALACDSVLPAPVSNPAERVLRGDLVDAQILSHAVGEVSIRDNQIGPPR